MCKPPCSGKDYGGYYGYPHTPESGWEYYGSRASSAADSALGCVPAEGNRKGNQYVELGINPNNDGKVIRLVFPELTEERRKELTKEVKKKAESV